VWGCFPKIEWAPAYVGTAIAAWVESGVACWPCCNSRQRSTSFIPRPLPNRRQKAIRCRIFSIVEPVTLGCPVRPLRWVSKSHDKLAVALQKMGHKISANSVRRLLPTLGYSRQSNRKADEGSKHPDRNDQFEHINTKVVAAQAAGQPVISVDTKKKELIGNYRNGGTDYRAKGDPRRVRVHDFEDKELGKIVPYGVYDVTANAGWVSVGITSDTAEFAVASIRRWLDEMGHERYPHASELTITADCGGSNGARVRLWKVQLQKFADATALVIHVHHYPPGTSKWNKIEHRLFCHITQTWRGRPLTDRLAVVELIAATTTSVPAVSQKLHLSSCADFRSRL
jgi:Rhodopirellula transposase DDE domain